MIPQSTIAQEKTELSFTISFLSLSQLLFHTNFQEKKRKTKRSSFRSLQAECFVRNQESSALAVAGKAELRTTVFVIFSLRANKGVTNRLLF